MALPPPTLPPDRRAAKLPDMFGGDLNVSVGADVADYFTVPGDPDDIQLYDDDMGGAFVDDPGTHEREESAPPDKEFYSNLAALLSQSTKSKIVSDLMQRIEEDKEARKKRDDQYADGVRRTGLGNDSPGGAEFEGASRVVHPMLLEACIDYASRIMKEVYPPSGPVKAKIIGTPTAEKSEKADRKTEHMNWQTTQQIKEFRPVLETTLTQVPLGGSQFIRLWWDHRLKRPRVEFASIDKIYVPYGAADFVSAHRKTFHDRISAVEYKLRCDQGLYLDLDLPPPSQLEEASKTQKAIERAQGVEDPAMNMDGDRDIYEVVSHMVLTSDTVDELDGVEQVDSVYPYLITIDVSSREMLSMYRAWEDGDEAHEEIPHLFEFQFMPWDGAYGIGFPHIIGGLTTAATGALRALMDSAHVSNAIGGYVLKGSGTSGQTKTPQVGELCEIDGGLETDDIRKRVMPYATNQPSPVLFQLLGFLVDAGKGVVRTSMDEMPTDAASPATPVGTQMSRVEEGLVVFSAVHGRAHAALNRLLQGLHRLNRLYLPEELKVDADGQELLVRRKDYEGPCDVQPVSDPTIYSDQQRFAQLNYMQQRMLAEPGLWKQREVELRGLKLMKVSDPESLLNDQPQPAEINAVNENLAISMGQPVMVFPEQDHLAHLQVHLEFTRSPILGANPLIAPVFLPGVLKHIAQHIAFLYVSTTVDHINDATGGRAVDLMDNHVGTKRKYDQMLAAASATVVPLMQAALAEMMPVVQAAMQMAQSFAPKPPPDPAMAAVQAAAAETQRKATQDQAGNQLAAQDQQTQAQLDAQKNAIMADRNRIQEQGQQMDAQTKVQTTGMDNQTAEDIATDKISSGSHTQLSDGASLRGNGL